MRNLSCENEFYLHENEKSFPYQRLSTYPRLETEARGNSEMTYYSVRRGVIRIGPSLFFAVLAMVLSSSAISSCQTCESFCHFLTEANESTTTRRLPSLLLTIPPDYSQCYWWPFTGCFKHLPNLVNASWCWRINYPGECNLSQSETEKYLECII